MRTNPRNRRRIGVLLLLFLSSAAAVSAEEQPPNDLPYQVGEGEEPLGLEEEEFLDNPARFSPPDPELAADPAADPDASPAVDEEPEPPVYNPTVACFSYHTNCTSCHNTPSRPVMNKPALRYAAFHVRNTTRETISYHVRWGKSGQVERCVLPPGKYGVHSTEYARTGELESPQPYVRFDGDPRRGKTEIVDRLTQPWATPNERLGKDFRFEMRGSTIKLIVGERKPR